MTDYDNKLTWTLFKIDPEKVRPNGPTYSGTFTDDTGAEFYIDAWVKTSKNGRSFFSGKAKRKQPRQVIEKERCNCDATCGENRYHFKGDPGCIHGRQSDPVERVREGVREHFGRSNSPIGDDVPF